MNITQAITYMRELMMNTWNGLNSVTVPIFNISFTTLFVSLLGFNWALKLYSTVTGGNQDKNAVQPGLDNNNHYIYRR